MERKRRLEEETERKITRLERRHGGKFERNIRRLEEMERKKTGG